MKRFELLITEVRDCTICASHLPHSPRPVLQLHPKVRLLIAGQARDGKFMSQVSHLMMLAERDCATGWV